MNLHSVESFLISIPATFWGVVIGSFFSLSGIYLSNRASERRQRSQFLHEHALRKDERALSLRRDVYLSAAEAIQAGLVLLGRMSNLDVTVEEHRKAYLEKLPALAKVQIVASGETIKAVAEISGSLSASILRLTGKRIPLDIARQRLLALRSQVTGFEKERDRWLEEMKQYNVAGSTDARLWALLQRNFKFEETRISETLTQVDIGNHELFTHQLEFAEECLAESDTLAPLMIPAVVAVRSELGIRIDVQDYKDAMQGVRAKQNFAVAELLETARRAVGVS